MRRWLPLALPLLAGFILWSGLTVWAMNGPSDSLSFRQSQARLFGDWFDFRPWNTPSINRVEVADGEALVSPVLVVAGWVGLSVVLLLLLSHAWKTVFRPGRLLPIVVAMAAAGWLLLDMRWQGELLDRLSGTRAQFAGKTWEEKRAADFDGPGFAFMQFLKKEIGDPEARVLVLSGTELYHFRARYHALPQPAWSSDRPPPVGTLRAGDFVVLLDDQVVRPGSIRRVTPPPVHELIRTFIPEASRDGRMYQVLPREGSAPGFYRMRVRVREEGELRLQVRMARPGGEFSVIAERWVSGDSGGDYSLPFLIAMPGEVEYRVLAAPGADPDIEEISVEWLRDQEELAFLAAARDGPFVVVRPFLQSDVAIAFEVL